MPNAMEPHLKTSRKILLLGDTGSGKTTQILTLPGKTFIYLFDPNAILSLQGHDIDYEEFYPGRLELKLTSLTKGKGDLKPTHKGAEVYRAWEEDIEKKLNEGFFDQYDNIGLDSLTTFGDLVMDGVLAINGRAGQWPQQDDYGPQMLGIMKVIRTLTALNKTLFITGHDELKQDQVSKKIYKSPVLTGRLRTKLPLLFSEILHTDVVIDDKGAVAYRLQTRPDRFTTLIRCTIKDLENFEDVTIDFNKPVQGQGLGGLLVRDKHEKVRAEGSKRTG